MHTDRRVEVERRPSRWALVGVEDEPFDDDEQGDDGPHRGDHTDVGTPLGPVLTLRQVGHEVPIVRSRDPHGPANRQASGGKRMVGSPEPWAQPASASVVRIAGARSPSHPRSRSTCSATASRRVSTSGSSPSELPSMGLVSPLTELRAFRFRRAQPVSATSSSILHLRHSPTQSRSPDAPAYTHGDRPCRARMPRLPVVLCTISPSRPLVDSLGWRARRRRCRSLGRQRVPVGCLSAPSRGRRTHV